MTLVNKICVDCEKVPSNLPRLMVCENCEKKWNKLDLLPKVSHAFHMLAKGVRMEIKAKDKDNA